jgi:chitin synthase
MTDYSVSEIFTSVARIGVILSVGSMFITGFLHGDLMAFAGAGLQYWFMQPVFWNILQVGGGGGGRGLEGGGRGGARGA